MVRKITYKQYISVHVETTQDTIKNRIEQHFQDLAQKLQYDKNSDNFVAHLAQHFDQKLSPKRCQEIIKY